MVKKTFFSSLVFLFAIVINITGCATTKETQVDNNLENKANYSKAALMMVIMDILQKNHINGENATSDKLFDAAIHGMVRSMDPYSDYEEKKELSNFHTRLTGQTFGIGVEFIKAPKKYPVILTVIKNSPAGKSNLKAGDIIKEIDNKNTLNLNIATLSKLIKGKINTKVTFTIIRQNLKEPLKITVTRNKYLIPSIPEKSIKVLDHKIGYIKVNNFNTNTDKEFYVALMQLKKQGIKSLIIDLRNNGGGIVAAASKMAALFLEPNKTIFTSYGRTKQPIETVTSNIVNYHDTKLAIVVLVNNNTASSSEIFTGALNDHKRAIIVGARTFGKGTLLKVLTLPGNNGALRYAFGHYHTPNGSIIEKKGITPHHKVLVSFEDAAKLNDQSSMYPGVVKPKEKNAIKDIQLAKAIEILSPKKEIVKTSKVVNNAKVTNKKSISNNTKKNTSITTSKATTAPKDTPTVKTTTKTIDKGKPNSYKAIVKTVDNNNIINKSKSNSLAK